VKREDFSSYWLRSGSKIPDKPKIFYKEKRLKSFVPSVLSSSGEDPVYPKLVVSSLMSSKY